MRNWMILFLAVSVSCKSDASTTEREKVLKGGPRPLEIHGELITSAPAIRRPADIKLQGARLWIRDAANDPAIHLVDAKNGTLIASAARVGEDDGEFNGITSLTVQPGDTNGVWAFELPTQRITRISTNGKAIIFGPRLYLKAPEKLLRVEWLNDSVLVGHSFSSSSRFSIVNGKGQTIESVASPLLGSDSIPEEARLVASSTSLRICNNPDSRGFAIVYFNAGRIEFYDESAHLIKLASVPFPSAPMFSFDQSTRTIKHSPRRQWYNDCAATTHHVFAPFSGKLISAFGRDGSMQTNYVHIFDWNGDLVQVLLLDHEGYVLTVDRDERTLYVASLIDGKIYRYLLPPTL